MQPLARQNDENPEVVEQWQLLVNGQEIIKAYSELVDPIVQQNNFDEQIELASSFEKNSIILFFKIGVRRKSGRLAKFTIIFPA